MPFVDDFSALSRLYAQYRPTYPDELFRYLASIAPAQGLALDCATGNGQAARGLVDFFERVLAFDQSLPQLRLAARQPKIAYLAARAERLPLGKGTVDLVLVAQALHWFDLPTFYAEARRILKPGGILAALAYPIFEISSEIDRILIRYSAQVLGPYWSPGIHFVEERYQTIPFPYNEIQTPPFAMETSWNLYEVLGYLGTWSATTRFIAHKGYHPLQEIQSELLAAWGNPDSRKIQQWPICLKVGVSDR